MAGRNVPVAIGFAFITVSQFALGMCLIVLAARSGGNVQLSGKKNYSDSKRRPVLAPVQLKFSYRSLLTRIACAHSSDIGPLRLLMQVSPSFTVRGSSPGSI